MVTARRGTPGPQNELEWISEFLDDREKKLIAMGGACKQQWIEFENSNYSQILTRLMFGINIIKQMRRQ